MDDLQVTLENICAEHPFLIAYSYQSLQSDQKLSRHGDQVLPSASTRKILILLYALREIHAGRDSLEREFVTEAKYADNLSGMFRFFQPGCRLTLKDALIAMICVSDNTCTAGITAHYGIDSINAYTRSIGLANTVQRTGIPPTRNGKVVHLSLDQSNVTTTDDITLALELLFKGISSEETAGILELSPALCQTALDILHTQLFQTRLPSMLPSSTTVAHKTGSWGYSFHDAGIIFEHDSPLFILSVFTDEVPEIVHDLPGKYVASTAIARLSRACYDAREK